MVAAPLWRRCQLELVQAAPYTVLYHPQSLAAVGPRLEGIDPVGLGEPLGSSTRWWISPARRR